MRRWRLPLIVLAVVLAAILGSIGVGGAATPPGDVTGDGPFVPDEVLVQFRPGAAAAEIATAHQVAGGRVHGEIRGLGVHVVKVPVGQVRARVAAYQRNPNVLVAEPNYIARPLATPNDPFFSRQWGLTRIQAPAAWELNPGSRAIHIAILDTGVDQDHEDLASKIVGNIDFTGSGTVDDRNGHGTHVAGIAAAATDNRVGIAGAGAASSLLNVKVLGDEGAGSYSSIANGLVWAADHGAKVINMSLGGRGRSLVLQQAVSYAWTRGAVLVAAAGNDGTGAKNYPAAYSEVIAVAATDANDGKASFSNYGPWVSLGAPGVAIYSTLPNHSNTISSAFGLPLGYASLSGTSMAAPHVAGVAALLWNASSATSNNVVRDRLQRSADPVPGTGVYWRYGRLNAFAAVSSATPAPGPRPGR